MNDDLISRKALKEAIRKLPNANPSYIHSVDVLDREMVLDEIDNAPTVDTTFREVVAYECGQKSVGKWIPVKYRPLTTEERIEYADYYGIEYCDTVDEKAFDCPMPEDGQKILVSGSWGVSTDVADNDVTDGGYTLFGLEENGDWEGINAWMPLPEPYKRGDV